MSMNKQFTVLQSLCCAPGAPPIDAESAQAIATTFKALADPTRVAIVNQLACCDECCVCDLTATFDLSQPTISHHLKILRDAGLVQSESRGTWAYYRLVPEALDRLRDVLAVPAPV
jgi:ArsR family transcriptional regulator